MRTVWTAMGMALLMGAQGAYAQETASEATRQRHAAMAAQLPPDDGESWKNATRGKLAEIEGGLIRDADGRIVWDLRPYAFLNTEKAPDTVNPSLWRQARLNAIHGLFEVVPGHVWQLRGYDLSVMTVIRGDSGWIVIDPLLSEETAAAAWRLFLDTVDDGGKRPLRAILFTHSHSDHFGGVGGLVTADQVARDKIRIIAPHGFSEEATSENILAGTAMGRRASYMFGAIIPPGPQGLVDTGLGPGLSAGTIGYMEPTETVPQTGAVLSIDGVDIDFMDAGGTEAPSEFIFYVPKFRLLHTADVFFHSMHNLLTLRGAQVRDGLRWAKIADAVLQKWGDRTDIVAASHQWPTWGAAAVQRFLTNQRTLYRFVHDRTLFLANRGATLHEMADSTPDAPIQRHDFSTRDYYGTVNHNMKATYQRYFGWWDGNPANFNPLPPEQSARRYVALVGGADRMLAAGKTAIADGDYRWAAELLNKLVFADPGNRAARDALAAAYDQLGYQAESGAWRNYYLAAAATLRGNAIERKVSGARSSSFVKAIPTASYFDALATRFDAQRGAAIEGVFQFILPDSKESVAVVVASGTEFPRYGVTDPAPTATIRVDRATLDKIMLGAAQFPALVQSGKIGIDGDRAAFLSWFALHPPADPGFDIVVP